LAIAASPSPPKTAKEAGCNASRTASHRDLSWHLFSSTSTSGLPTTVSRKYDYADNVAIIQADGDWQAVEGVLTKDMATVSVYLQT